MQLIDRHGSKAVYGATIRVSSGGLVQTHETTSAHGYNSTSEATITFGLGARSTVESIEVRWPGGASQTVAAPGIRSLITIVENTSRPAAP